VYIPYFTAAVKTTVEQHCYYFLFQGRKRPEGVLRSEDHHDEDGHQELLRQQHFSGRRQFYPHCHLLSVRQLWHTTPTIKTSYLHGSYKLFSPASFSPSFNLALQSAFPCPAISRYQLATTELPSSQFTSSTNYTKALTKTIREAALTATPNINNLPSHYTLIHSPDAGCSETQSPHFAISPLLATCSVQFFFVLCGMIVKTSCVIIFIELMQVRQLIQDHWCCQPQTWMDEMLIQN